METTEKMEMPKNAGLDVATSRDLTKEIPRKVEGLRALDAGGAVAVTNTVTGAVLMTNKVGGKILELIDGNRNVADLALTLALEFPNVDPNKLRTHVDAFVLNGEKQGVLSLAPKAAPVLNILNASTRRQQEMERERTFHPDLYWYLTFRCNLACTHCSVLSSPHVDTSTDLKTDDCLKVIDQLEEMQVNMVMLSGGEVLIRPDALKILRALMDRKIFVGLETNGLKSGEPAFIELALEMQAKKLLDITVSLDGGTAETHSVLRGPGSFERTVRAMRTMHEHGVVFAIQCVLNRDNYKTIPDLYDLATEIKPDVLLWSPLNSAGRGSELIKRLGLGYSEVVEILDLIDRHKHRFSGFSVVKMPPAMVPPKSLLHVFKGQDVGCSTSCKFPLLGVLPNGDITVCGVSRNDSSLYFGNVRDVRLKNAWEKARMDLLRKRYVSTDELQGICGDCIWKNNCKGSCRAKAYEEGGDFFSPYPVCQEAADRGEFPDAYRISKGAYAANS